MAIIYSYPQATPTTQDYIIGTKYEDDGLPTKSFPIQDIVNLSVNAVTGNGWNGVFDTNALLNAQVTVVNGIITDVQVTE